MSLYDYRVFETVVRQGSFSKASKILHVTPSAISHIIAKLEDDFGFPLLSRNRNGVRLTADGRAILDAIEELLLCDERLNQEISDLNGFVSGTVRIASFSSAACKWIPGILTGFKDRFPQIDVRVRQGTYAEVASWIDSGAVDLAFVTGTYRAPDDIEMIPLKEEPLYCVMPQSYPSKSDGSISVSELGGLPLIHSSLGAPDEIQEFIETNDLTSGYEYILDDDNAKLALVEAGHGICVLPEMCVDTEHFDIKALPVEPAFTRSIYLAVAHSRFLAPATEEMKKQIIAYCEDLR